MSDAEQLLRSSKTIAVVGISSRTSRPSHGVSSYMQDAGYRIIPVNPQETEVLGEHCYATLAEVTETVDIVNIFRQSNFVMPIVEAAIQKGAKGIWMQEGVIHEEAAARAKEAGLLVVMDACILKAHMAMRNSGKLAP